MNERYIDFLSIPATIAFNAYFHHKLTANNVTVSELTLVSTIIAAIVVFTLLDKIFFDTRIALKNSLKAYAISIALAAFVLSIMPLNASITISKTLIRLAIASLEALAVSAIFGRIDVYTVIISIPLIYAYPLRGYLASLIIARIIYKLFEH